MMQGFIIIPSIQITGYVDIINVSATIMISTPSFTSDFFFADGLVAKRLVSTLFVRGMTCTAVVLILVLSRTH
jgi:hypothetical protein